MAKSRVPPPPEHRITPEELAAEIRNNQGIIHGIAGRWYRANRGIDREEYVAAVEMGFCDAARLFDKRRGYKFATYAGWWADNHVRKLLNDYDSSLGPRDRRIKGRIRVSTFSQVMAREDGVFDDYRTTDDLLASPEPPERFEVPDDFWPRVRKVLDAREYLILKLYYSGQCPTYEHVGKRIGVTRERVRQIHDRALRKAASRCDFGDCLTDY